MFHDGYVTPAYPWLPGGTGIFAVTFGPLPFIFWGILFGNPPKGAREESEKGLAELSFLKLDFFRLIG